jgi:hypothetical protein
VEQVTISDTRLYSQFKIRSRFTFHISHLNFILVVKISNETLQTFPLQSMECFSCVYPTFQTDTPTVVLNVFYILQQNVKEGLIESPS